MTERTSCTVHDFGTVCSKNNWLKLPIILLAAITLTLRHLETPAHIVRGQERKVAKQIVHATGPKKKRGKKELQRLPPDFLVSVRFA